MSFSPTIRLFVSSTFSDLKAERNVLQDDVFPRLKQLCLTRGFRFQAIDLRWGISEEAGRDNKTMRICLRELRRCQQDRPKPNFLILLGDRYGWRPLPEIIPAALFEKLATHLQSTHPDAAQLLQRWYRLDENAVPPAHELQPRGDDARWAEQVEKPLLAALEHAAQALGLDLELEKEGVSIGASATEQEIIEGALNVSDAAGHVRAFFRTIDGLPANPPPKDYVDTGDPQAKPRLDALKDRIQSHLGNGNVCSYRVRWRGDGINRDDLKEFCDQAWEQLSEVVEQQIAALTKVPPEVLEEQAHQDFGAERCRRFVGREEPLRRIADYLSQGSGQSLVLTGPSGSGKSAVMARAVQAAAETNPKAQIFARYIGATPASSDLIQLLRNLVAGIRQRYTATLVTEPESGEGGKTKSGDTDIPFEFNPLVSAFHEALKRPTADQPLFLFLDSLDQLTASHQAHALTWLPGRLSEHVRLVVSAALAPRRGPGVPPASTEATDPRTAVMAALTSLLDASQSVTLAPLSVADGEQMLTNWLADAHRTLQPAQRQAILETFQDEGSPLWLRTATEEAARLASWQPAPSFAPTTPGLLGQVLDRLSQDNEHGKTLVSRTLSYLACARHGLAEDEILDILSADLEVIADFLRRSPTERSSSEADRVKALPVAVWVRLHGDLAFYLAEHQTQGASLLGFYHRSFLEAVTAYCLATAEARRLRHQHLSDWFRKQAWFLAPASEDPSVPPRESRIDDPPNARKASELPWHLYKTADESDPERCQEAVWQPLAEALCDILLVEAKVRSGLVFELQKDHRLALDALPEVAPEVNERQKREARIEQWTEETVAYARAWSERRDRQARAEQVPEHEPVLPEPVSACRMWTQEEIDAECRRISEHPTRLDRLRAFAGFAASECHALLEYGQREGFVIQHAFNQMPSGPVHAAAAEPIAGLHCPLLLRRWPAEARPNPMPALLRTLGGHNDSVKSVSVTPDGRRAVSGGEDHRLRVWDLETGACLRKLEGHGNRVKSVSVTPDGRRAVSASYDFTLRVWDLETGACLHTLKGHSHFVESVSVTPDGRRAVSASTDKTLRVWDLENGTCLRTLEGHNTPVSCVSLTPDGRRAISGSGDYQHGDYVLRVWDLESGDCLRTIENPNDRVQCVSVMADGRCAVSGSGAALRVWDLENGTCLRTLEGHTGGVESVTVTPDGQRAVSGSLDHTLRVWDVESGTCLRTLEGHSDYVRSVSVTPDGRRAVSAGDDKTLRVWDLERGGGRHRSEWVSARLSCLSVTPDGLRGISGHSDHKLRVWDLESCACLRTLEGGQAPVFVSTMPDGLHAVSGHGQDIRLWDLESGACLRTLPVPGQGDGARCVCVTPDGRRAVSGGGACSLRVWDLESGTCLRTLEGRHNYVECLSVTPDGGRVVSAGGYGQPLRVWDLESGVCIRSLEGHRYSVKSMSMSSDGRRVVSGGDDKTLRVWDLETGACLRTLEGHLDTVGCVRVTPDDRCAVSGSNDKSLRVWDLETGACLSTLEGHGSKVNWLSVTPDSRRAVSTGDDATVRVWDLESGTCVALFLASAPIESFALSQSTASVICGTTTGEVIFLQPRGIEFGPPLGDTRDQSTGSVA